MKKGQLQIHETILVLFIFIVLLIIGMIVFYRYNAEGLKQSMFEIESNKFNAMLSTFAQSPEIRCSFLGQDISCVDSYKLIGFKKIAEDNKGYYREKLGNKNITFYLLYPFKNNKECDLANTKDCGVWNIYLEKPKRYEKTLIIETPISLYFPETDDYGIGKMVVTWYT